MKVIQVNYSFSIQSINGNAFVLSDDGRLQQLKQGELITKGQLLIVNEHSKLTYLLGDKLYSIVSSDASVINEQELNNPNVVKLLSEYPSINIDNDNGIFQLTHNDLNIEPIVLKHDNTSITNDFNHVFDQVIANAGHDTEYQPEIWKTVYHQFVGSDDEPYQEVNPNSFKINAVITINNITSDDVINAVEAKTDIAVHGLVGADVKVGDIVTVTIDNHQYKTHVEQGLIWSVNVAGHILVDNPSLSVHASVTTSNQYGHSITADADHAYKVDTDINAAITITNIADDDVINATEAKGKVAVSGMVGADVKAGDIVHLTVDGKVLGTAIVNADLTWTAQVDGATLESATKDSVHASVTTTDKAGNAATAETDHIYSIDTDINAAITITKIAEDDVINATEAKGQVAVSGTVGADVKAGDIVHLTVDGNYLGKATVKSDLTWSTLVDGSTLENAAKDSVHASVTATDKAGNSATAETNHTYSIDTDINAAITITNIAEDDVINAAEAKGQVAVSGTVGKDVKVGDIVHLTVDDNYLGKATVNSDLTWSTLVDGATLVSAKNDNIHASVTASDSAGNTAYAETDHNYIYALISITKISNNYVVNAAKPDEYALIGGTVGGSVKVGDEVKLSINGIPLCTTYVEEKNGELVWNKEVLASELVNVTICDIDASVSTTGEHDNVAIANANHPYIYATISITEIADDDVINSVEAKEQVAVSGSVGGDVKAGDVIHLSVDGKDLGTAIVKSDHTWTAQVDGETLSNASKESIHATVSTQGSSNNIATAETDHIYSIDTDINAAITIINIADDDVINAAEAKDKVTVSGMVDKDVKAGDIVHLTVDGKVLGTATVKADLTWTAQVDGATLASASKDSVHASVTTTDKAGNSATAETDHIYSIDTKIDAEITITKIAEDDVINATEAKGQVAVSGTVGADVKAGDIVHLTVDGKVLGTATVKADLTWTAQVDGATLESATKDSVHASVTTTDKAGNSATAETDHIYSIDTKIDAEITITKIAEDDVINATEAKGQVAISGTVDKDVKAGDIVHLTVDGKVLGTATVKADLTWSTLVDGATLAGASRDSVHASVTTTDKAGNAATAETDHIYSIDTEIAAAITITNIADDDVINTTEAKGKVAVSGTVGKDVKAGDIVHLTVDGKDLGTATVNADLTWTAQVDGATLESATKDSVHASVTTTGKAGNSATAETDHIYSIDTKIDAEITITKIAEDDVINATEAKGQVAISGTVDKDVKAGDIVHLTVDGNYLGKATVNSDLTWTAQVDGATLASASKDSVHASVTTTDKAGNSATAETDHIYSIDTKIDAEITIIKIAEDDVINATEAKGQVAVSGTVGADVKAGDIVHLTVDGKVLGTATVKADLTWSTLVDGATLENATKDSVHASVTTTDKAGNSATAETDHIYNIDTEIAAAITITNIADDDVINATEAKGKVAVSGTVGADVKAGDIVHLTVDGNYLGKATVNSDLTWSTLVDGATLENAAKDSVHASVTTIDKAGNSATAQTDHLYSIDTQIAATITITNIADDDVINAAEAKDKVTVSGTVDKDVKAGDIVHLTVDGKDLGTATVKADLTWSTQVDGATLASASKDSVHASVTTTDKAGNSATAETNHAYSIDTDINAAITITNIADDDVINATEAKGKVAVSGTVDKDVKAGDIVHLTVDGKVLGTATVKADLTWTAQVDGATLENATKDSVHASVTTTDKAGNSATAETNHAYSIDTDINAAITITNIADDDVINATEAKGKVAVSGTVDKDVKAGDIVHLTVDGKVLGTATVNADLTWTAQVDGATLASASKDSVHASVTTTDKAGNAATAETDHVYSIDTEIAAAITITHIAEDDVINATEAKGQVAISGSVGKDVKVGDIVHLTVDGKDLGSATVKADLTWTAQVDGATLASASKDSVHASVITTDKAGNSATAETDHIYSIDTEIAAAITITNIADDDVINATEAKGKVAVSGTVGKDVKAGDIVHLTVDGKDLGTATVNADLTWSTLVDGVTLENATKDSVHASVTTTDKAGNTATAETDHVYSIDTEIAAAITITHIAEDDVINATEAKGQVAISGSVGKDVKVGDIVHLTVDGKDLGSATVKADLTWTAQVDGATLASASKDSVHASVTTTDKAGNSATAETDHIYSIDTKIDAEITITKIAEDDVINATEAKGQVAISGTVDKDVKAGDIVHLTVDGKDLGSAIVKADLTWTVQVDGATLASASKDSVHASVTATDKAGNTKTAETDHVYSIDTQIAAAITITHIAEDDVINATEAKGKVTVSGTVGADVKAGDIVHLTVDGKDLGSATVNTDLTWSTQVDGATLTSASKDSVHASVTATDKAGNSATAETDHIYSIDTKIDAEITINSITADNVINMAERQQTIKVSGAVGKDVQEGDLVTIKIAGKNYTTKVDAQHHWSVGISGTVLANADTDTIFASVTTHDAAGNTAVANTSHVYQVSDIKVGITIDPVTGDNIIDATESTSDKSIAITGHVSGNAKVGDIVELHLGSQNLLTKVIDTSSGLGFSTSVATSEIDDLINQSSGRLDVSATIKISNAYGDAASAHTSEIVTAEGLVEEYPSTSDNISGTPFKDIIFADDDKPDMVSQATDISVVLDVSGSMSAAPITASVLGMKPDEDSVHVYFKMKDGYVYDGNMTREYLNSTAYELSPLEIEYPGITVTHQDHSVDYIYPDKIPNRLDIAKESILLLEHNIESDMLKYRAHDIDKVTFNLVTFDYEIRLDTHFHWDGKTEQFVNADGKTMTQVFEAVKPEGGTDYDAALTKALKDFSDPKARNILYFVSDGDDNNGLSTATITQAVGAQHIKDTHPEIVTIAVSKDVRTHILQDIAAMGEGYKSDDSGQSHFVKVVNPDQLKEVFLSESEKLMSGNDTVNAGAGDDIVISDIIDFDWLKAQIKGTPVNDKIIDLIEQAASEQNGHQVDKQSDEFYDYVKDHISQLTNENQNFYGNDTVNGGDGNDLLFTGGGRDIVNGQAGNDVINTGSDDDTVLTGQGTDTITTGDGQDTIVIVKEAQQESFNSIITDFTGQDKIDLSQLLNNNTSIDNILNNVSSASIKNDELVIDFKGNNEKKITIEHISQSYNDLGSSTHDIINNLFDHQVFNVDHNS